MSYALTNRQGFGDLTCFDVDVDQWDKDNRVPLFSDRVNTWVIKLSMGTGFMADSFSPAEAEQRTAKQIEKWFAWKTGSIGRVEVLSVRVLPADNPVAALDKPPVATVNQTKNPTLGWEPGSLYFLEVRFVYRGANTDMPWPRYSGEMFGPYCPKATRYGVYAVYPAGDAVKENPCDVPGAALQNPDCNPLTHPSLIPWWVWAVTAGVVIFYAYPVIAPVAGAISTRVSESIKSTRSKKKG